MSFPPQAKSVEANSPAATRTIQHHEIVLMFAHSSRSAVSQVSAAQEAEERPGMQASCLLYQLCGLTEEL